MIDEKSQKRFGTSGMCYGRTNVQPGDCIESTLLWQRRFKHRSENMRSTYRSVTQSPSPPKISSVSFF